MQKIDELRLGTLGLALGEPSPRQTSRAEASGEEVDELAVLTELLEVTPFRCDQRDLKAENATSAWETVLEDERPGRRCPVAPPPGAVVGLSKARDDKSRGDQRSNVIALVQRPCVHLSPPG
jgi:hypothetical protein